MTFVMRAVVCALSFSFFLAATASTAFSQLSVKSGAKRPLADVLRKRTAGNSLVLPKPSDRRLLAIEGMTSLGDPCDEASPIHFGQGINGALTNADCQLEDGSYADAYVFEGLAGEPLQIDMTAGFDAYLIVSNMSGTWVLEDDDSGGGGNARIIATLPESGTYIILANSFDPNTFGNYWLSLAGGPQCSFAFDPPNALTIPHTGGTFSFNVTTGPRCYWAAGSLHSEVSTSSAGLGNGTVTYNVSPNPVNQPRNLTISVRNSYFNIRQDPLPCTYTLSSTSVDVGPFATTGSFNVTAPTGCFWSASESAAFISAWGSANGNGTANFSVTHNNGAPRSGMIRIAGTPMFTVNQNGLNCTYAVNPSGQMAVSAAGLTGNYVVNTQAGCTWNLVSNFTWIQVQGGLRSGPMSVPYTIQPQTERNTRTGAFQFTYSYGDASGGSITTWVEQAGRSGATTADFDGDFKSDLSIFRPSTGHWWVSRSSGSSALVAQFGTGSDQIVPADYTGDRKVDMAFWRPSTGEWYILRSENFSFYAAPFGTTGDIPAPADFDNDGKADLAVFRPSNGTWYIQRSTGGTTIQQFGANGDIPVPADYDANGSADLAIYRPSNGQWWLNRLVAGLIVVEFGNAADKPVPGDYTGDGRADVAIWRPSSGEWFILRSEDFSFYSGPFGTTGDLPSPGDYDGDGRFDPTVFRPSNGTWYSQRSTGAVSIQQFGVSGDRPVSNAFVP